MCELWLESQVRKGELRAVALLGDLPLDDWVLSKMTILLARLPQKNHDIRVLLDRIRFSQMPQLGLASFGFHGLSIDLAKQQNRHIELGSGIFESLCDAGDFKI